MGSTDILQNWKMEPGFNYGLERYAEGHNVHSCFSVIPQFLEPGELAGWVEEQGSEYNANLGKVGAVELVLFDI